MRQSQEGRALRQFTLSTGKSAGRNSLGRIMVFHRGLRQQRKCNTIEEFAPPCKILESTTTTIRGLFLFSSLPGKVDQRKGEAASLSFGSSFAFPKIVVAGEKPAFFAERMREKLRGKTRSFFSRAAEHNESKPKMDRGSLPTKPIGKGSKDGACKVDRAPILAASWPHPPAYIYEILDLNYQIGNCIPLTDIRIGTRVHDIECHPSQGAKPARAAGTFAKIMMEPAPPTLSLRLVRLPSGVEKLMDSRCRATIGRVSNPKHGACKLRKAVQSRWLGKSPFVRDVTMNPVDHPYGGGEGCTKGGRPLVSP
ncbi:hypothetical protein RGQ29_016723 [Quercus rubra]|uniref:Large ribosomal subunit protein uL2 C-terminal domain-containing protein n=1 Tax=Quercus rubra TaxID=3512 RepID=A0AAN7IZY8_QUERU|nr:hypothetical protein RGQ29_016723 [Quercus rubra]